jgi:peptide/nickel transport system permease protein
MQEPNRVRANDEDSGLFVPKVPSAIRRVASFAAVRLLTIGATIIVGVFIAIVVANKGDGIDVSMQDKLQDQARRESFLYIVPENYDERERIIQERYQELAEEYGLYDPFIKKHIRWTARALTLDFGDAVFTNIRSAWNRQQDRDDLRSILLERMPNTMALVGLADFLVFVVGIPLALNLSRNYGGWFDKLLNILSPLSSVPSWVHGVLLILIFAVTFRLLPPGGMIESPMPETRQEILASRLEHMILPTLAIFLSLLFQLVYTWRNYFMIYANEDYVDLAVAKGLSSRVIENKYILRPAMPYVLTSFALTLVSFWQMATALEVVFNWDGIGRLYILSLPHFFGESMFPGEVGLTIGIVVIFAYILGLVVFLLDIAYALVDPRIRIGGQQQRLRPTRATHRRRWKLKPLRTILPLLIVGILLGLGAGWWLWPAKAVSITPADLRPDHQLEYTRMLVDSYAVNGDNSLAAARLNALGEDAATCLATLAEVSAEDPEAWSGLQTFAINFVPDDSASLLAPPPADPLPVILRRLGGVLALAAGAALLIGGGLWLVSRVMDGGSTRPVKAQRKVRQPKEPTAHSSSRAAVARVAAVIREMARYPSAVVGMVILGIMLAGSLFAVIRYPYKEIGVSWSADASENSAYVPRTALPTWINFFRRNDLPETIRINSEMTPGIKSVQMLENGNPDYTFLFEIDYPYAGFPTEGVIYVKTRNTIKEPFASFTWTTPSGEVYTLKSAGLSDGERYALDDYIDRRQFASHQVDYRLQSNDLDRSTLLQGLFMDPDEAEPGAVPGRYLLEVRVLGFEPGTDLDLELVLLGQLHGWAGTDFYRRDLSVPLLWGMPFALGIGLFGALLTTIVSMMFAAFGVWFGGWADSLVQRITEANMILPVVAIAVLFYAFYGASLWAILTVIVVLNAFGSPTKTFRAAFLQIKDASYIEAAQAYGAPNHRIIMRYMIPRILPVLIPQLVTLIPGFIFLEATLGMFNVHSTLPTWGKVIYEALYHGAAWGSKFWVLEPIALLLLTGFAFSMMGFALDRVLNPRLREGA